MLVYVLILSNHANNILYIIFNCNIVQAPSRKIWICICDEDQVIFLSQKYLKEVSDMNDLKVVIKEQLKSSLRNISKEHIRLSENSTSIAEPRNIYIGVRLNDASPS